VKAGDQVTVSLLAICGNCYFCNSGLPKMEIAAAEHQTAALIYYP